MSELIVCCNCGELSTFDHTIYIDNNPTCPSCCDSVGYVIPLNEHDNEKRE